jgi:hypothetical protein
MLVNPKPCLFDIWQTTSAPIFHTGKFWPSFSEANVRAFIMGDDPNPTPSRALNESEILRAKSAIETFLDRIEPLSATEYACKAAYQAFEAERLATLDIILAAAEGNRELTAAANDTVFGRLADLHPAEALGYLKHRLEHLNPAGAEVAAARQRLLDIWADVASSTALTTTLDHIDTYRRALNPFVQAKFGFVDELLAGHPAHHNFTASATCGILQATIERTVGAGAGWHAVTRDDAPNAFIEYATRSVVIPAGREYSRDHVYTLAVHEIGVHVTRSINGEHSHEPLAGQGLAGYSPAEEGFGVLLQHASKPHFDQVYAVIAFALIDFADRLPNPSFRDLHRLTRDLIVCLANPTADALARDDYTWSRRAFTRTNRLMRLGTGVAVERSTTKYWRGLLLLSQHFDQHGLTDHTFAEFFLGKYNPLEPSQLQLITFHRAR